MPKLEKQFGHVGAGFGQPAVPGTGSSPYSAANIVAGLLSSPITSESVPQEGLPPNLNGSNPLPIAPAPAVVLVSQLASQQSCRRHACLVAKQHGHAGTYKQLHMQRCAHLM